MVLNIRIFLITSHVFLVTPQNDKISHVFLVTPQNDKIAFK